MAGNSVDIIIRAVEKGVQSTFSKLGASLKQVNTNLTRGQLVMANYNKTMETTKRTAGALSQSVGGLVAVLGGGALFGAATKSAFGFNQSIEQSKIGIAALVRTFTEVDMDESFRVAVDIQKQLRVAGLETTATYQQLLVALQEGIGPALRNGFDPKQVVAFTSAMTQAAAAISLPMDQLGQELRAIMDGAIDKNARIAKVLGIDNDDIKEWKAAGVLFEKLEEKLRAFVEAGGQMAGTFGGEWSNFTDAIQMALGDNTQKTFAATTAAIHRMKEAIVTMNEDGTFTFNPQIVAAIDAIDKRLSTFLQSFSTEQLATAMTNVVDVAAAAIDILVNFTGVVVKVFEDLGPLGPLLVKITGYLAVFSVGWKVLAFAVLSPLANILKFSGVLFKFVGGMAAVKLGAVGLTGVFGMLYAAIDYDVKAIVKLINNYYEYKQLQKEITALQAENAAALAAQAKQYEEISKATGVTVRSMQELDAAVKAGKISFDESVGAWVAGNEKKSAAVKELTGAQVKQYREISEATGVTVKSAQELDAAVKAGKISFDEAAEKWVAGNKKMAAASKKHIAEMKKDHEDYTKRVIELQDKIAGKQQSTADSLREMRRDAVSELGTGKADLWVWKDQKAEADEFYKSAQRALSAARSAVAAGNEELAKQKFEESAATAEKAEEAYKGLSNTVKDGDKVLLSMATGLKARMTGVDAAGKLGMKAMNELKEATQATADQLGAKITAEEQMAKAFSGIAVQAEGLEKQATVMTDAWGKTWTNMSAQGNETIADLERRIQELTRDRHVNIIVTETVKKFAGGMVQRLATGGFPRLAGKLPGSDGPDGIRALLAPGEFIMRSAAVRKYGAALFQALNSMRLDVGSLIGGSLSGALGRITVPSMEPVRMFNGGLAGAGIGGGTSNTYNLSLTIPGQPSAPQQANARALAQMVLSEFEKMHRGRS